MQFTRTNIITEGGTGKSLSSGGIVLEGNQGGGGGEYIHPTGWLWGNRYTGRETLDGDLTSNGTISALNINATNITSVNGDFTNLTSVNLTSENGDFRYLNVYDNLYAWGADIDHATIRELFVSGSAHFVELIIDKINSTNGSLILSPAHAELTRVEEVNGNVYCYFPASDGDKEISNDFDIDDLVICESFNAVEGVSHDVDNKFIWKRVIGKGTTDNGDSDSESDADGFKKEHYIIVKASSFSDDEYVASGTNTEFERGDVICTLGNWTKPSRQKAILMTSTNPKFLDIGTSNPDPNKPYDVTVWDDEAYMRTAPIGVCNDVCTYDNLTNEIIRDVYPLIWSNFSIDYYRNAFTNNLQDLKTGHKITLKIRPHFDTTHYDINKYDNDCYKDDDVNNLIIFKMLSFGILRQFVLHKSSTEWWGEYKYMLVRFTLYSHDDYQTAIWDKCYKVRDLNLTDNEVNTIVITDADNTYGEEISNFKIVKKQDYTNWDMWDYCNYIVGSIGNPFSFNTGEPGYGEYYKNNCVYLNNEVYDFYNYKFLNPDNIVLASYKVPFISGDVAKYQEEVIPNGNFNDNRHWLTTFSNAPEGYSDFINTKECVYMRRPLCKEVYVYGSTQMGGMTGNYLKSDEFTFPYDYEIYELSFDYYVGNDNSVNDEQFYFQFTIHDVYMGTDHHKIIYPDKVGYHKCRIYLSVHPKETTLYDSYYIPNVIHLHYDGIVDGNDRVEKLPYYISFNTDMCGNQNQLVIDNVHLRAMKSNFMLLGNELTSAYTYDSTTERRYRGGSVNPIDAPAIITFNNINEFSLADKHVSVLSPTFNLISASSISGLDDLTNSISSLNTRVTNCETNITTNSQQIALKADKTTVNTLSGEVTNLSSAYTQTAEQVAINVSSISELNGAVTSLNSSITVLSDRITLNSSAITSLNGSVSTLESEFSVIPGQISSIVSSISSLEGEDVRLWSSISQLPTEISAYVYNEIDGDLTQTGIDITNHTISLTADNFFVKNNNNQNTLYLNSQGLVESRLGFITNPRVSDEETFNPIFYALSKNRFNNDPLAYSFGLSGYDKAINGSPRINLNPDYTDSVYIDHFKLSTEVFNRNTPQSASDPLVQYRIPIMTMQQDDLTFNGGGDIGTYAAVANRTTLKIQPKEIAITWHDGGTPQLGLVKDLDGNDVPGIEGWIGGVDRIISIGPGGCYLKDAISTVIYTGQDSFEEWIRTHGTDTTWTNIPSGAMVRVKHYAGDSYSQLLMKD